jgi:hypothetical protein
MKIRSVLFLLCLAASAPPRMPNSARMGHSIRIDGLRIIPLKILTDSRCPMNARCIWAGEVKLRVAIYGGRRKKVRDITLGKPEPIADGALTLTNVTPARMTGKTTRSSDYRFTFTFEGGL